MTPENMLRQHHLLGALEASEARALLKHAHLRRWKSGDVVFRKGEPGDGIYGVLEGRIVVTVGSEGGREIIVNSFGPGEFFGEIALLDGKGRTATAVVRQTSELLFLARSIFLPFIEQRPQIAVRMIALLCERLRRTTDLVQDSMFLSLQSRLAKQLLVMAPLADNSGEAPPSSISVFQSELAQMIGVSREAVSKQLSQWREANLVSLSRGRITIDNPERLEEIVSRTWRE